MRTFASWLLLVAAVVLLVLSVGGLLIRLGRGEYVLGVSNILVGLLVSALLWKGGQALRRKVSSTA